MLGQGGLCATLQGGALVINLSTGLPSVSRRLASRLEERGIDFADAPVSGGEAGARSATLAIMAGARPEVFDRCRPYLLALGKSVVHLGGVGAGGVAKLVNNMIVGAAFAAIAEGFGLAERSGVNPLRLYQAIREGWAGGKVLEVAAPAIAARSYVPGGTIDMLEKDLSYARTLALECQAPSR